MIKTRCPHCHKYLEFDGSTFVARRDGQEIKPTEYHPDRTKRYKTSAATRRRALEYYYAHRPAVLAREKRRRDQQPPVHVSIAATA